MGSIRLPKCYECETGELRSENDYDATEQIVRCEDCNEQFKVNLTVDPIS